MPLSGTQTALADGADQSKGPGRILLGVIEVLEEAGIRHCILHGYEDYPQRIGSDVDCVIDAATSADQLCALLHHNRERIGAEIVRRRGSHIVLAGSDDGAPCFLILDVTSDCQVGDLPFHRGAAILAGRRRHGRFWAPASDLAFGCYLVRTIAKGELDERQAQTLSRLYREDPAGCAREVARFWSGRSADLLIAAARSHAWGPVRHDLPRIRAELRWRAMLRAAWPFVRNKLRALRERIGCVWRPQGLNVVLLGPDGAGKSSVIAALGPGLVGAFPRSVCWGFAPPLHRLFRRGTSSTSEPHALPVRSLPTSLVRAAYWFAYYTLGYANLHRALARSTLVLHDRHFVDLLVDRKRYRYGGPSWLIHLIWRLIPKPDLVIVLDAPAEVLQRRKQEVPLAETARQRHAYLSLARSLENGYIVDATRPLREVADQVRGIVLRHLGLRMARRLSARGVIRSLPCPQPSRPGTSVVAPTLAGRGSPHRSG